MLQHLLQWVICTYVSGVQDEAEEGEREKDKGNGGVQCQRR